MKTLLIIGAQGTGKTEAAQVAAQIAVQHHNARIVIHDRDSGETSASATTVNKGEILRIVIKQTPSRGKEPATRVLNMDRFARFPRGKAVTFAIREAVDACLASR